MISKGEHSPWNAFDAPNPGMSMVVVYAGQIVAQASSGMAELETGRACQPTTNYRLASVSKQFTALLIGLLAQQGLLMLHQPIGRLLPGLQTYASRITPHQLLTHTSGLVDYEDLLPPQRTAQIHDAEIPALLPPDPQAGLYFAPGTQFRYSNTGYVLLAQLAEAATGQPFPALLHSQIFAPLGMQHTLAYVAGSTEPPERAFGYTAHGTGWQRTDQSVTSATLGDGGIYSSVSDLMRWLVTWDTNPLGGPELARLCTTIHVTGTEGGYGYGWFIDTWQGQQRVWHYGTTTGFRTALVRLPEQQIGAVVLCNRSQAEPVGLAMQAISEVDAIRR